jgi:hypothetical protein
MGECLPALRLVLERLGLGGATAVEPFRAALTEALRQGPARDVPDPDALIVQSGLADRTVPLPDALARFDLLAALPPGRAVLHGSFGAGRVKSNDGEIVILDFAKSSSHRMPYAAARRTLTPLAEDDLRLIQVQRPAEVARMREEDQGEIIVRALRAMGGSADAAKLKLFLVGHHLVPAAEWTVFFRKARAVAVKDPRIDHARAFEQHYQLAPERPATVTGESATKGGDVPEAAVDTPLPGLEPRKPVKTNLGTIRKFLAQHPQAEAPLAKRFGKFVERALFDPEGQLADRARAGLYFARWSPARRDEWTGQLRELWERGLAIGDLSGEHEQLALLDVSHSAGIDADATPPALDSCYRAVRTEAARYRDLLDDAGRAALRRTLIDHGCAFRPPRCGCSSASCPVRCRRTPGGSSGPGAR